MRAHRIRRGDEYRKECSERQKKYRREKPEHERDKWLRHTYGVPAGTYNRILESQEGRCAICETTTNRLNRRFDLDHCHDTGKIRGLLCHQCNLAIGQFKHSEALLLAAIKYLKAHQA